MSDSHGSNPGDDFRVVTTRAPTATPVEAGYVAEGRIPPSAPPASEVGIFGWLYYNLFYGWLNAGMTLAAVAVLAWLLPGLIEWAYLHSVWNANSLSECRDLMDQRYGEGVRGACSSSASTRTHSGGGRSPPSCCCSARWVRCSSPECRGAGISSGSAWPIR